MRVDSAEFEDCWEAVLMNWGVSETQTEMLLLWGMHKTLVSTFNSSSTSYLKHSAPNKSTNRLVSAKALLGILIPIDFNERDLNKLLNHA